MNFAFIIEFKARWNGRKTDNSKMFCKHYQCVWVVDLDGDKCRACFRISKL